MTDIDLSAGVLARAQDFLARYGGKVQYRMGDDDLEPTDDRERDGVGIDCSAFVARCQGLRKKDAKGRWWGTDRIYDDTCGPHERWRQIDAPKPGCIGVYPGRVVNGKRRAGHVWIVEDVARRLTIEASSSGKGIARRHRPNWFQPGATGNGRPIIWAVACA